MLMALVLENILFKEGEEVTDEEMNLKKTKLR